jgi:hypothetical protein
MMQMVRTCNVCGRTKPLEMFPKNGKIDGVQQYRKDCTVCYTVTRKATCKKGRSNYKKFVNNMKHRTGELVDLTLAEWRRCLIWFEGCCAYCGKKQSRSVRLTKDHLVPCVAGGSTTLRNIVPACTVCNCSKGGTEYMEWYRKQPTYLRSRENRINEWVLTQNV